MGLVESRSDGGLVIAEESADESLVRRALKRLDPTLELTKQIDTQYMRWVYKVHSVVGSERPPVFVTDWRDKDGTPRPLTMGLIERIRRLDKNTRGEALDSDQMNEQHKARLAKDKQSKFEALRDEVDPAIRGNRRSIRIKEKPW